MEFSFDRILRTDKGFASPSLSSRDKVCSLMEQDRPVDFFRAFGKAEDVVLEPLFEEDE